MPQFLIAMTAEGDTWEHLPEADQQRLMSQYDAWVEGLRSRGVYQHGAAAGEADVVSADGSTAPVPGARITGFFVVEAPDRQEATSIATGCPALEHGETVVVYALT